MKHRGRHAGVTLAEMVIVLAVLSVLTVFAVPAGLDWWRRETVVILADRFASALTLAQSMSRNQRVWVYLGPLNEKQGWSSGWALYSSPSHDQQDAPRGPAPDSVLMTVSPPVVPPVSLSFRGSRSGVNTLSYSPVGYSRSSNGAQFFGTLTIASGTHVRRVVINSAGRARICNPATPGVKACGTDASADDA
ncbi:GspH/FimT family pseudopilin [Ralstonia sp. UBA689]|uniref:GspH/FimT family pseudopilin n=1 Tax=Ralstonia sp. UBA689 TaxID=1947373 RepID=UPI0039C99F09